MKPVMPFVFLLFFSLGFLSAFGQNTYNLIAKDTIITREGFLSSNYFLDGKKLNLTVMEWFMNGHPNSYNQIRVAILIDNLSTTSYSVGGVFLIGGLLIHADNKEIGGDLMLWGGLGLASGLVLQLVSNHFQRLAVRLYNEDIRALYGGHPSNLGIQLSGSGLGLIFHF